MTYEEKLEKILEFARRCQYEPVHSAQVRKLAEILFSQLRQHYKLTLHEFFLLSCAAILHDIGWMYGQAGHHKNAMRIILDDKTMPLSESERKMVALIARYHRKALPRPTHAVYEELSHKQQRVVSMLGGILRIADGLDRSQVGAVQDVKIDIQGDTIIFLCSSRVNAVGEIAAAQKKADLFEKMTGCKACFRTNKS